MQSLLQKCFSIIIKHNIRYCECTKCKRKLIYEFYLIYQNGFESILLTSYPFGVIRCVDYYPYILCQHSKTLEDFRVPSSAKCLECNAAKLCECEGWLFKIERQWCREVSCGCVCDDCYDKK